MRCAGAGAAGAGASPGSCGPWRVAGDKGTTRGSLLLLLVASLSLLDHPTTMALRSRTSARNGQATGEDKLAQAAVKTPPSASGSSSRVDRGRWRSGSVSVRVCALYAVLRADHRPSHAASRCARRSLPRPSPPLPRPHLIMRKSRLGSLPLSLARPPARRSRASSSTRPSRSSSCISGPRTSTSRPCSTSSARPPSSSAPPTCSASAQPGSSTRTRTPSATSWSVPLSSPLLARRTIPLTLFLLLARSGSRSGVRPCSLSPPAIRAHNLTLTLTLADAVNGTIYYLVGVLWCLSLYPRGPSLPSLLPLALAPVADEPPLAPADIAVLSIIMLSLCDTSASVFGRLFGRYTPRLPFAGTLFGAKKSLAGTLAAVVVGMCASHVFWSRYAALGDEGDVSWLPARMGSAWRGKVNGDPLAAWGIHRLPNPQRCVVLFLSCVLSSKDCRNLTHGPSRSTARSTSTRSSSSTDSLQVSPRSVAVAVVRAGAACPVRRDRVLLPCTDPLFLLLSQAIDFFGFDDNLSLPVFFGFFCWASMYRTSSLAAPRPPCRAPDPDPSPPAHSPRLSERAAAASPSALLGLKHCRASPPRRQRRSRPPSLDTLPEKRYPLSHLGPSSSPHIAHLLLTCALSSQLPRSPRLSLFLFLDHPPPLDLSPRTVARPFGLQSRSPFPGLRLLSSYTPSPSFSS